MLRIFLAVMLVLMSFGTCAAAEKTTAKPLIRPVHEHRATCEMTKPEPLQIVCILDRSGSMSALVTDTIGGYNSFLAKQREEPGEAQVTTVLFDGEYEKIADAVPLKIAPNLTGKEYYARGTTALLDAVGLTISDMLGKMEKEGICPAKRRVLFMIMTDGQENSSREYNKATVKGLIDLTTEKYKWNYIFMGANIDSVSEAAAIGIGSRHAVNYSHNSGGVEKSFARMDAAVNEMRETGAVGESWKE